MHRKVPIFILPEDFNEADVTHMLYLCAQNFGAALALDKSRALAMVEALTGSEVVGAVALVVVLTGRDRAEVLGAARALARGSATYEVQELTGTQVTEEFAKLVAATHTPGLRAIR